MYGDVGCLQEGTRLLSALKHSTAFFIEHEKRKSRVNFLYLNSLYEHRLSRQSFPLKVNPVNLGAITISTGPIFIRVRDTALL